MGPGAAPALSGPTCSSPASLTKAMEPPPAPMVCTSHHRHVDGHRVLHFELRAHRRHASPDETHVAARAAHVVGDHILEARARGRPGGGHHPRSRAGHDRVHRGVRRHPRGHGAAVAAHDQDVVPVRAGRKLLDEAREVAGEDRLHAGVDRGRGAALVLAELGEDLVARGDVVVGPERRHDAPGPPLVLGVAIGVQEVDHHRLAPQRE